MFTQNITSETINSLIPILGGYAIVLSAIILISFIVVFLLKIRSYRASVAMRKDIHAIREMLEKSLNVNTTEEAPVATPEASTASTAPETPEAPEAPAEPSSTPEPQVVVPAPEAVEPQQIPQYQNDTIAAQEDQQNTV